ncbi:MAG TPA: hypothetical protein VLH77_02265, partial [Gammaproteobacteria bacterium]|nr:hypothetical protein [Gammaproteobacteria bacterium]
MLKLQQQIASGIYGINRVGNMAIALFSIRRSNFHFLSLPNPYLFFSQPQRGQAAAASLPLASPSRRLSAVNFPEDLIPEIFRCALL